jgi:5-dehydro-4-deoxyglucarate dehydratase
MNPGELKQRMQGLLAFTLTPFDADLAVDLDALAAHVERLIGTGPAAIFPACGLGEFFSLSPEEYRHVIETCVRQVAGRVPVVAGVGYGTALARSFAQAAEESGADGLLVMPPYLVDPPQDGLAAHYRAVAAVTRLGVIVYQRGNAIFAPATVEEICRSDNVIGFKDGLGEIDRLLRIRRQMGDRLGYINGMPTAEVYVAALSTCGVAGYSSALLTFVPEIATEFYAAVARSDRAAADRLLDQAIIPFAEIRQRVPSYAVSLVKAGARLRRQAVGSVRTPLADPVAGDVEDLRQLLKVLGLDSPLPDPPAWVESSRAGQ